MVLRYRLITIALATGVSCGCATLQTSPAYHTVFPSAAGGREAAEEANARGLSFADSGDYGAAEGGFREALRADVTYPAAHNNLGLVLLAQGRFHESALEFSFAKTLDPQALEPLVNLGRLYETVGWYEAAITEYEEALVLNSENAEAIGRLAYARMTTGKGPDAIQGLLRRLVRSEEDTKWKAWALAQLPAEGSERE